MAKQAAQTSLIVAAAGAIVENGIVSVPFNATGKDGKYTSPLKAGGFVSTGTLPMIAVEAVSGGADDAVHVATLKVVEGEGATPPESIAAAFHAGAECTYVDKLADPAGPDEAPKEPAKTKEKPFANLSDELVDTLHAHPGIAKVYVYKGEHFFTDFDLKAYFGVEDLPKTVEIVNADEVRKARPKSSK